MFRMAGLPSPPFELDAEPPRAQSCEKDTQHRTARSNGLVLVRLVTGSVEISNDRLVQGFSWLVASVQADLKFYDCWKNLMNRTALRSRIAC